MRKHFAQAIESGWWGSTAKVFLWEANWSRPRQGATLAESTLARIRVPRKRERRKPSLNDGRELRRYRHCWKVERTFAWLGNFRRRLVRYDYHIESYQAFFNLACLIITPRLMKRLLDQKAGEN